ncbi:alpha/beta fold hydrolase [Mucilaginibacter sp.]|uniref:alpha/beta fold hydrolase n=1 Tax=Mucilaginibacter sp. TaxID=1882438 RepID=UPI002ED224C3
MKRYLLLFMFLLFRYTSFGQSKPVTKYQAIDTLVDAGNYKIHFCIVKGHGTPILFEAGGGDDASVWTGLLKPISELTGTTLITYDRPGFGRSTLDTNKHGLLNGIRGLETALHRLGYDKDIILVAHSQGAFSATVYAYRHPDKVKAAVLIDGSTSCWFDSRLSALQRQNDIDKVAIKTIKPGLYYQYGDISTNVKLVRESPFPTNIPIIDIVSGRPPFDNSVDAGDWRRCHEEFVKTANNRTSITAYDCGHYIFIDNPALVINCIAKVYAATLDNKSKTILMAEALDYNINASNETKKEEALSRHSENDLNSWGYSLIKEGKNKEALGVFKLNTLLNPDSWNAFDSYGEALLKNGEKQEAIKMYQKSVELNPKSESGKKTLQQLKQ